MTEIIFATGNKDKMREIREIMADCDVPPCVEDPPPPVPQAVIPITIDAARIVAATFFKIFFIRCPPSTLIRICFL